MSCSTGRHILPFSSMLETHGLEIEAKHTVSSAHETYFSAQSRIFLLAVCFRTGKFNSLISSAFALHFPIQEKKKKSKILLAFFTYYFNIHGQDQSFSPKAGCLGYWDVIISLCNFNSIFTLHYFSSSQSDIQTKLKDKSRKV